MKAIAQQMIPIAVSVVINQTLRNSSALKSSPFFRAAEITSIWQANRLQSNSDQDWPGTKCSGNNLTEWITVKHRQLSSSEFRQSQILNSSNYHNKTSHKRKKRPGHVLRENREIDQVKVCRNFRDDSRNLHKINLSQSPSECGGFPLSLR